jgi:hypothetical protein
LAASFARRFKNQLCSVKLLEPAHEFVRIGNLAPSCSLACHILCSSAEGTGEVDVEPGLLLGLLEINLEKYGKERGVRTGTEVHLLSAKIAPWPVRSRQKSGCRGRLPGKAELPAAWRGYRQQVKSTLTAGQGAYEST